MEDFNNMYSAAYDFFYNFNSTSFKTLQKDCIAIYDEFIDRMPEFKKFLCDFVKYQGDFLTSDREVAAFTLAYIEYHKREV